MCQSVSQTSDESKKNIPYIFLNAVALTDSHSTCRLFNLPFNIEVIRLFRRYRLVKANTDKYSSQSWPSCNNHGYNLCVCVLEE